MLGEIKEDLGKRDFTMNSVAWSPKTGLIDPYCGLPDIKHKTIRAVCEANMRNDPLRLLRAYRFSGELRFEIEKNTRKIIRKLVDFIKTPASERITYEFIRLLNSKDNEKVLHMAYEDGMLKELFYINDDKLRDNIKLLHETNKNLKKVPERFFLKDFSQGLCGEGLIRLESLLLGSFSNKLVLSKNILTQIGKTEKLYKTFVAANAGKPDGKLYNLYKEAGCALLDLIVLSGNMGLLKSVDLFQKIEKNGLLSSEEIMTHSGFREGKKLGDLIEKMKMLEFTGAVKNKASAIKLLKAERI